MGRHPADAIEQVVLEAKYAGYIERQAAQVERFQRLEAKPIPAHFDYAAVPQLRVEAREKLARVRPPASGRPAGSAASARPTWQCCCSIWAQVVYSNPRALVRCGVTQASEPIDPVKWE